MADSALPYWDTIPEDLPAAIRSIKRALQQSLAAAGRTPHDLLAEIEDFVAHEVADIDAQKAAGDDVWPVIEFADIAGRTVTPEQRAAVLRRGCLVIRNHFDRDEAAGWDRGIVDYVEANGFFEHYRGPGDDFFTSLEQSRPEIYPIYWSPAQMQARQHPHMAAAQRFLNSLWNGAADGRQFVDTQRFAMYPDRIRRRPEGAESAGLGPHIDTGTLDLWLSRGYQQHFAALWDGDFATFDPWAATYRTQARQYPGSTMCSAFRTFQGWTALSDMDHDQGVLHTVPIPTAIAHLMVRPLLDDIADDDLCGVRLNRAFPARAEWHRSLLAASSGIPDVRIGDSVWWHCDMIHSVAPVTGQRGWGNVMYIPAAPWCERNEHYAASLRAAFEAGESPSDFPDEHYEATWTDRCAVADLNDDGRAALGYSAA